MYVFVKDVFILKLQRERNLSCEFGVSIHKHDRKDCPYRVASPHNTALLCQTSKNPCCIYSVRTLSFCSTGLCSLRPSSSHDYYGANMGHLSFDFRN